MRCLLESFEGNIFKGKSNLVRVLKIDFGGIR